MSLEWLKAVKNGFDPRKSSELAERIQEYEYEGDDEVLKELLDELKREFKYKPIAFKDSLKAAITIAEYEHAKKKSIETNANVKVTVTDLTEDEIKSFVSKLNTMIE